METTKDTQKQLYLNLDKKLVKTLENALITLRNHIPYDVFCKIDKMYRKRLIDFKDFIQKFSENDNDGGLYEDLICCEIHAIHDMEKMVLERYEDYEPGSDHVFLVPGRKYKLTFKELVVFEGGDYNHPMIRDVEMTYEGRAVEYKYGESHIFTFAEQYTEFLENRGVPDNSGVFTFLTCIGQLYVDYGARDFWRMQICPDKFFIVPM